MHGVGRHGAGLSALASGSTQFRLAGFGLNLRSGWVGLAGPANGPLMGCAGEEGRGKLAGPTAKHE
jgi:hypothetical protein